MVEAADILFIGGRGHKVVLGTTDSWYRYWNIGIGMDTLLLFRGKV